MSEQNTVPCPACKGDGGRTVEFTEQATGANGQPVTVYRSTWQQCGPCVGSGQIVGGH